MPKYVEIGQSVAEISRFFDFSRLRSGRSPSLICPRAYLDHPRRVFGGLYHFAKFGCDNMKVSIFGIDTFGLKTPIHASQFGFRDLAPKSVATVTAEGKWPPAVIERLNSSVKFDAVSSAITTAQLHYRN